MNDTYTLFEEFTNLPGIAGHERNVAAALKKHYLKYTDEIINDGMGSIFAVKRSKAVNPFKVMICAHMDEVGFIVSNVMDNGMLKIHPIGGWNPQTLLASKVAIYPQDDLDKVVYGVIGSLPPHLLKNTTPSITQISEMLVDVGATSSLDIKEYGIKPGDMVVVCGSFKVMNNNKRLMAKAWDDRYGCVLGLELLAMLKDSELPYDLYIGGTTQEEVGLRGAKSAVNLIKPDLAIVLDASPANDVSGDKNAFGHLGKGGLIRIIDANMMPNQNFINYAQEIYEKLNLNYQYYISMGGTDAGAIHTAQSGIPTLTACLCARYIHTSQAIIDFDDYVSIKTMLNEMLLELDKNKVAEIYQL